jgi:homoserine O-acetyltransferase
VAVPAAAHAATVAAAPAADERVAEIGAFAFEHGGRLARMRVGYATWGHLAPDRGNVVLLLPPTSGTRHSYDAWIGPGRAFDTDRFFVIAVDPIGGGRSSQPGDGLGSAFPRYTIRDMVEAQRRLLSGLGIDHLHAVAGASMGSFQAVEWGVGHPDAMDRLLLVAPAARSDAHLRSIVEGMAQTLTANPHWSDPGARAAWSPNLRAAAAQFYPWLRSDAYLDRRGTAADLAEAQALGDDWAVHWDPVSLLWRYRASAGHDAGEPYAGDLHRALARIRAKTLIVANAQDRTVPAYLTRELAQGIAGATTVTVPTDSGHAMIGARPGSADFDAITAAIRGFL